MKFLLLEKIKRIYKMIIEGVETIDDLVVNDKKIKGFTSLFNKYKKHNPDWDKHDLPTVVFQVWWGIEQKEIPDEWKESRDNWIKYHPDYLYILFNKKLCRDFIDKYENSFLDTYDKFEYNIQRIDIIRYIVLKHIKSIYCDLDCAPMGQITDYVKGKGIGQFPLFESGWFSNNFMISDTTIQTKKELIWDMFLRYSKRPYKSYIFGKHLKVMFSSGPAMITEAIKACQHEIVKLPLIDFNTDKIYNSQGFLKNLSGRSWQGADSKLLMHLFDNRKFYIVLSIIILISIIILVCYIIFKYYKKSMKYKFELCEAGLKKCD